MKPGANGYRLPTEAQWEYAARGGGTPATSGSFVYTYAGSNTVEDVAVYITSATAVVGSKAANTLGLYDMSGNVWEWCWDWYDTISAVETVTDPPGAASGAARVIRGGGWYFNAPFCAVSFREIVAPSIRDYVIGFRVSCP
jgi:formylglycine-generating enzyme required for sulfatase activity